MKHLISSALTGLSPKEATLIQDAFNGVGINTLGMDPRNYLLMEILEADHYDGLFGKWEVDQRRFTSRISRMDRWQADLVLEGLHDRRGYGGSGGLEATLKAVGFTGLNEDGIRAFDGAMAPPAVTIRYVCGHTGVLESRLGGEEGDSAGQPVPELAASVDCFACRAQASRQAAVREELAPLEGPDRDVAIGDEIRRSFLEQVSGSGLDREGARLMVKKLILSYLGSISDASWWVERREVDPRQIVNEVSDGALLSASPEEIGLLLEHPDPGFREKVISTLGENRNLHQRGGEAADHAK